MSGRAARSSEASSPRLLVLDGDTPHEVFEVLAMTRDVVQARSAYLFEVGEELAIRIEAGGSVSDALARVRCHVACGDDLVTELEISDRSEPRPG